MGELLFIDVAKRERDLSLQEAWDRWVAADARAKETKLLADGLASGRAYVDFLELYARGGRK